MKLKRTRKILKINLAAMLIIAGFVVVFNQACSSALYSTGDINMKKIENSSQYNDGKFRNKIEWAQPTASKFLGTVWDFLFTGSDRTPDYKLPRNTVDLSKFSAAGGNQLNVTWLGHSSLMINIDGYKILTDPVFQTRVSFFGPTRFNGKVPLDTDRIPEVDVVLISHNHYDHLNKYSIQLLNWKAKRFIVPLAVGAELEGWGVPREKITELDWWDETSFENLTIAATPTQHFSGRGLTDRDKTLWASFVVKAPNHKIFFSGDSGYFQGFKEIGNKYGPFDMTFVECGAYNENWHHIHMFPEETVKAHIDLKGNVLHPIHWGTFNLSLHPWYEPMQRLAAAAESAGIKTATPVVGGTTEFGINIPSGKWWEKQNDKKAELRLVTE